jgi:hypothetical protein
MMARDEISQTTEPVTMASTPIRPNNPTGSSPATSAITQQQLARLLRASGVTAQSLRSQQSQSVDQAPSQLTPEQLQRSGWNPAGTGQIGNPDSLQYFDINNPNARNRTYSENPDAADYHPNAGLINQLLAGVTPTDGWMERQLQSGHSQQVQIGPDGKPVAGTFATHRNDDSNFWTGANIASLVVGNAAGLSPGAVGGTIGAGTALSEGVPFADVLKNALIAAAASQAGAGVAGAGGGQIGGYLTSNAVNSALRGTDLQAGLRNSLIPNLPNLLRSVVSGPTPPRG